jgi:serine/threonine-protein kinase RsbT
MVTSQARVATISSDLDIVTARSMSREVARSQGFGAVDQARIATAVGELARNIFLYAKTGRVIIRGIEQGGRKGIEIVCEDQGPGIANIELSMQEGYSTSGGMGMGIPGARRLMHEFNIQSQVGAGTTVTCRKWCP